MSEGNRTVSQFSANNRYAFCEFTFDVWSEWVSVGRTLDEEEKNSNFSMCNNNKSWRWTRTLMWILPRTPMMLNRILWFRCKRKKYSYSCVYYDPTLKGFDRNRNKEALHPVRADSMATLDSSIQVVANGEQMCGKVGTNKTAQRSDVILNASPFSTLHNPCSNRTATHSIRNVDFALEFCQRMSY